MAKTKIM